MYLYYACKYFFHFELRRLRTMQLGLSFSFAPNLASVNESLNIRRTSESSRYLVGERDGKRFDGEVGLGRGFPGPPIHVLQDGWLRVLHQELDVDADEHGEDDGSLDQEGQGGRHHPKPLHPRQRWREKERGTRTGLPLTPRGLNETRTLELPRSHASVYMCM